MQPFIPPTALDRPLTADEDAALRWILWLEDFPGAEVASSVRVPASARPFDGSHTRVDEGTLRHDPCGSTAVERQTPRYRHDEHLTP